VVVTSPIRHRRNAMLAFVSTILDDLLDLTVTRKGAADAPLATDITLCCSQSSSSCFMKTL
jgi:hypothetical protein